MGVEEKSGKISRVSKISRYLENAKEIKKWMEEIGTTKPPSKKSEDKEEKRLWKALYNIRYYIIKKYKEMEEEEKSKYREEHPEIDEILAIVEKIDRENVPVNLGNARAIKKWMEERKTTKPPAERSKNKEEKKLAVALNAIKHNIIKPYKAMTEEESAEYREKHPEIDEILGIVEKIDRENVPVNLENARAIGTWMEEKKIADLQSKSAKDKKEKRLRKELIYIRGKIIKPYQVMTEEERAAYREKHPEIDEILGIVEKIDRENVPVNLGNARAIKKWMEKNNTSIPPRAQNKKKTVPEEEVRLGTRLRDIRSNVIKPYKTMTEEERAKYRVKHPEIDEILLIISEIDAKRGKKTQELDSLVEEARKRMEMLKQAKELEAIYEENLGKKAKGQEDK